VVSTRSRSTPTRREDTVIRVLALGAVVIGAGGLLVSSQQLPAPAQPSVAASIAHIEADLPAYVVGPNVTVTARPAAHPATGRPLRVSVPDLGISAPVVDIFLTGDVLVPPADPQVLGWWTSGAEPGALRGTAVVTGHTVSTGGGALDDLHLLARGDRVLVATDAGRIRYEVTDVVRYSKEALTRAADRVFSQEVPGRLVLVTCTDFDGHEYLGNTLVFAVPAR
jgi:LPXTG-site transpeptidase (sortase) family protein